MVKKLIITFAAAAAAVSFAAAAYAESPARLDSPRSIHKRHQPKVDAGKIAPQVGKEKWVVLLCRFQDSPQNPPFPRAKYDEAFNTHPKSHKKYFKEASYGKLNISAEVNKWRTIANRNTFGSFSADGEKFMFRLYDACTKAHDPITNFADFDGIAMFFDDRNGSIETNYGYFNLKRKPLDGANGFRVIWMAETGDVPNEVTAHEMHHAYGAPHSVAGTDSVDDTPEGNECRFEGRDACGHPWDLMNSAWLGLPTDTHTLAATKIFYHKWITGAQRCNVVNDGVFEFELHRLARPLENRCLAITIKHSEANDFFGHMTFWYVVEARFPVGFDEDSDPSFGGGGVPGPAVIISRICIGNHLNCSINNNGEPVVLGRDEDDDGQIDEASAEWQAGGTFVNFDGRIKVEVLSQDAAGFYNVRVTLDTTP